MIKIINISMEIYKQKMKRLTYLFIFCIVCGALDKINLERILAKADYDYATSKEAVETWGGKK